MPIPGFAQMQKLADNRITAPVDPLFNTFLQREAAIALIGPRCQLRDFRCFGALKKPDVKQHRDGKCAISMKIPAPLYNRWRKAVAMSPGRETLRRAFTNMILVDLMARERALYADLFE